MPNIVNRLISSEYERELGSADGLLFVSMAGLTVQESEGLRASLDEQGVKLRMVRNKLVRRVLSERGLELSKEDLTGNVAIAYGETEAAIVAAKVFTEPAVKKAGKIAIRAGVLEGELLGAQDAASLADVPDRDTLRAMILSALQSPARGIAMSISGVPGGLARVLQAHADQSEG